MGNKLKNILTFALCGILLFCNLPVTFADSAETQVYAVGTDIDEHWAEDYLEAFIDAGYLKGDDNGNVNPSAEITRAQYASLINRIKGYTDESKSIASFTDVFESAWYRSDLAMALAAGYMQGTEVTKMEPEASVTREMAIVMTARVLGLNTEGTDISVLKRFSDADKTSTWAMNAMAAMVSAGYIEGDNGKLNPQANMTRSEGTVMLYRTHGAMTENVLMRKVSVAEKTYWYVNGLTNYDNDIFMYMVGDNRVAVDALTQIGNTGVYYYCEDPYKSSDTLYGTTTMTFAEYYLNEISKDKDSDTVDKLDTEGMYDAVTSATSEAGSHSTDYPTILNYTTGYDKDSDGYYFKIDGIDTVDVSVTGDKYAEAIILNASGIDEDAFRATAIRLSDVTSAKPSAAKPLLRDGTYGTQMSIDASAAKDTSSIMVTPTVSYSSGYGNYQFILNFTGFDTSDSTSDLYYANYLMNMYAATITDESGNVAGTVYYEDTWDEINHKYWVDIALSNGSFIAKGHTFQNSRFTSFFGYGGDESIMNPGKYAVVLKSRGYGDINTVFTVGTKLGADETLTVGNATIWGDNGATAEAASNLPDDFTVDSMYLTYGNGSNAVTLTEGTDFSYDGDSYSGKLTINNTDNTGVGSYTLTLTDNDYQPAKASFTVNSDLAADDISIVNNTLIISKSYTGNATIADYIAAISGVSVDGTSLRGPNLGSTIFNEVGSVNFNAAINNRGTLTTVFAKGADASYELVITATGYPTITTTVIAPSEN